MSCRARWCIEERPLAQVVSSGCEALIVCSACLELSASHGCFSERQRWTPWQHSVARSPFGFSRSLCGCRELEALESDNSAENYEERLLQLRKAEAKK